LSIICSDGRIRRKGGRREEEEEISDSDNYK
jgi:hypothetical protein